MPNVFSIVVTYNGLNWVDKCFGSLINSSIPVNIIAIDNASTDGTPEYIQKHFPEVDLIENKENLGFGQANNIGIRKAYDSGADYVFLLNQDAWVEKDTIEKLVNVAKKNPEFGIISPVHLNGKGDALDFSFEKYRFKGLYSDIFLGKIKNKLYEGPFVNAAAWLISRECIETVGGFNPLFFMYGEDDNYLQRVFYYGFKVGVYPFAKMFHDSESRKGAPDYFKNPNKKFEMQLLLTHCNPNYLSNINNEAWRIKRSIFKSFIKLNKKEMFQFIAELKLLNSKKEEIIYAHQLSKKPSLTFL